MTHEKISQINQQLMQCPICYDKIRYTDNQFLCENQKCNATFPVVNGIPVIINENRSVFLINDIVLCQKSFSGNPIRKNLENIVNLLIPSISINLKAESNYEKFQEMLLSLSRVPRILVLGGRILGRGMQTLLNNKSLEIIETDVTFGPRTKLICDAHDIPFVDKSFDGVIVQAVLEHVVDPYRCVEEIHRVLRDQGIVYAETPFMQQVHGGRYDFTRFTPLGHRRLFRGFEEVGSGAIAGPGTALAWSYQYFLLSFTTLRPLRGILRIFAGLTSFYLKYLDYFLIEKRSALDAASACFFLGRKSAHILDDRSLVKLYKGAGS